MPIALLHYLVQDWCDLAMWAALRRVCRWFHEYDNSHMGVFFPRVVRSLAASRLDCVCATRTRIRELACVGVPAKGIDPVSALI